MLVHQLPLRRAFGLAHHVPRFQPQNKRVLDDTEKRFAAFFDQLSNRDIADAVIVSKALELTAGERRIHLSLTVKV